MEVTTMMPTTCNVVATFAPCRDATRTSNEQRDANHVATRANLGGHAAFRLAENGWFLLGDWLRCGRDDSGVFARKTVFFDGK
jgi:hypothetical protein